MATYKKTPGVYVEEISTLPPSVAEVATAIPAFIGYTEKAVDEDGVVQIGINYRRIISMLEYEQFFGGAPAIEFTATLIGDEGEFTLSDPQGAADRFILYYALKHYFQNGGGPCYIVSIGGYDTSLMTLDHFTKGLNAIEMVDEPTLLLFPDATAMEIDQYGQVCDAALRQCRKLQDRFVIMDVPYDNAKIEKFKTAIPNSTDLLKYGAAYTPYLDTLIPYVVRDEKVALAGKPVVNRVPTELSVQVPAGNPDVYMKVVYKGKPLENLNPTLEIAVAETEPGDGKTAFVADGQKLTITLPKNPTTAATVEADWKAKVAALANDDALKDFGISFTDDQGVLSFGTPAKIEFSGSENSLPNRPRTVEFSGEDPEKTLLKIEFTGADTITPSIVIEQASPAEIADDEIAEIRIAVNEGTLTIKSKSKPLKINENDFDSAWTTAFPAESNPVFSYTRTGEGTIPYDGIEMPKFARGEEVTMDLPAGASGNLLRVSYSGDTLESSVNFAVDGDQTEVVLDPLPTTTGVLSFKAPTAPISVEAVMEAWNKLTASQQEDSGFQLVVVRDSVSLDPALGPFDIQPVFATKIPTKLSEINMPENADNISTALYNQIKQALSKKRLNLPPSGAMAGIYAQVDRTSGVWKSPANIAVSGVQRPSALITAAAQEDLNVDATSGKSINAIRSFTGKGTLVWGARTLAGNDNEWRYISVRRLFNLIEESIQKSTSFAVFEPNDTSTWLKVKAMIDSYLYGLWQQGALAGSTAEQAFFVQVGLGKTMNTQDILEGRMIIEVGIAAVRPAEFIILRFSHKLQEA